MSFEWRNIEKDVGFWIRLHVFIRSEDTSGGWTKTINIAGIALYTDKRMFAFEDGFTVYGRRWKITCTKSHPGADRYVKTISVNGEDFKIGSILFAGNREVFVKEMSLLRLFGIEEMIAGPSSKR